ncbi:MAG: uroporphyrinogen decarboxylase family protein [Thermoleophilia bacterium]
MPVLPPDRMSHAERMAAVRDPGRRPDRVPFVPRVYGYPMALSGWAVADAYCDADRSFRARLKAQELAGYDDPFALYAYASMGAWEFGGEVKMPAGEYGAAPSIARHPVACEDDVERLRVPEDVLSAGSVPIMLEFAWLQARHGLPVSVDLGTPFTDAANVVEPSLFLKWLVKRPDLAHHVLRIVTDFFLALAAEWVRLFPGCVIVGFDGTPGEANTLISAMHFREFAQPYMQEVHEKGLEMGVSYFHTHICGEHNANLAALAGVPFGRPGQPGMVSFGHEVALSRAIEVMGDSVVVMGNVNPAEMRFASPECVFDLAREAVLAGRDAPVGFVLMSGCEVPVDTPLENLAAMLRAARTYGRYE